ncbi:SDR family NAD(P)-dependent oxidoreductase [Sandaracinobacteroides saxicola]|uniref:SDR family oxidoreductase n=1 Tax=Sandaracinobacteroides saxicola TaxID=2759707 RepID=A0A7G5IJI4_9SPHN|nr:SDR family NAD(P)-dependent oxidoreductase [Sandaracinobacteroides saxicola]QMW23526.1 SDR family oxidoreductase [Sandaracinobacteroides saxicola]
MSGRLAGKSAIITGATGGIGSATAETFAREGAKLLLVGRDAGRLEALAARLPGEHATFVGRVAEEADVEGYVAAARARFGRIDVLFANAGDEGAVKPLSALTVAEWDHVQAVNVRGPWLAIKHAAPLMAEAGGGSIVLTSSVAGLIGFPGLAAYAASKHAMVGLTKVAALEFGPAKVRVNAVCPAPIDNAMMASVERQVAPDSPEAAHAMFATMNALKRYGTNQEVANIVLFLASDEAEFCTGTAYPVDGGFLAI